MNLKKSILWAFCSIITFSSLSQTMKDAVVIGTVPVGANNYAIINVIGSNNFYKTSLYSNEQLTTNQELQLLFENDSTQAEVLARTLNQRLFAYLINYSGASTSNLINFNMPINENGILFFENETHIQETMIMMETYSEDRDIDDMLDNIELQFEGYTSFRTWFNIEYNWLDGTFTSQEIETISNLDFLSDDIFKTLINDEKFIGMGDSVYYLHSSQISLRFHKDYIEGYSLTKTLTKDDNNLNHNLIELMMNYEIEVFKEGEFVGEPKGTSILDDVTFVTTPTATDLVEECNGLLKQISITLKESHLDTNGNPTPYSTYGIPFDIFQNNSIITIDWHDGNLPPEVFIDPDGTIFQHTYSTYGIKHPTITWEFFDEFTNTFRIIEDGNGTQGSNITLTCSQGCGSGLPPEYEAFGNAEWQATTKIWASHFIVIKQVGAWTHFWKATSDGGWSRHKADLYVSINAQFRKSDCTTNLVNHRYGTALKHLQRKARKAKFKVLRYYYHQDGEIFSEHYFTKGNLHMDHTLELGVCE